MILETQQNWFYHFWAPTKFYVDFASFSHFKQKLEKISTWAGLGQCGPRGRPRGPDTRSQAGQAGGPQALMRAAAHGRLQPTWPRPRGRGARTAQRPRRDG